MPSRKRFVVMKHAERILDEISIQPEEADNYPILAFQIKGMVQNLERKRGKWLSFSGEPFQIEKEVQASLIDR